jgi:NADH:ubiquinone oxidoreductase subunit 6 (subunit J)
MKTKYSVEEFKFNRNMTIIGGALAIVLLIAASIFYFIKMPDLKWVGILMIVLAVIMVMFFILIVSFFNYKIKQMERE